MAAPLLRRVAGAACSCRRSPTAAALSTATAAQSAAAVSPRRAAAAAALRRAHAVCFDVDSTVITVEGIDELAAFAGRKAAVAALTAQAMGGAVKFEDALAARLALISPTAGLLARFLAAHPFCLTPSVAALVEALRARGTAVYLVSGGFTQMIHPVADALGVPRERVFANTILFSEPSGPGCDGGRYVGFDATAPTSRDGGKPEVVRRLKAEHGYECVVMVGDGATDMQARPPADAFIGYGGIVVREPVRRGADWFVTHFDELLRELKEGQR